MTLTKNYLYQGPAGPGATVVPTELNPFQNIRRLPAMADVADLLVAGVLCYLTGTTNASDMTPCVANFGDTSLEGIVCVVEIQQSNPYYPTTTEKAVYPNKIPNTTCTITDYSPAANTHIIVIPLDINMWFWTIGSVNGSWDTVFMTEYENAANGLIAGVGDPDGVAIDMVSHKYVSVATTTNQNWSLMKYVGKHAHDKTA